LTTDKKRLIAKRAAQEIVEGSYVSLSPGIPSLITQHLSERTDFFLFSESGVLGLSPKTLPRNLHPGVPSGGKEISVVSCASFFCCAEAYAIVRGGHLDLCVMGGLQVDEQGNLANWMVPGKMVKGLGSAMDLAYGAKRLVIAMEHTTVDKRPKIMRKCSLPLTGIGVVHRIITEMAVIDVLPQGLLLREVAAGYSVEEVCKATEAGLKVDKDLKIIQV